MKTSLILFATAAAVPFLSLFGLSGMDTFSVVTAMGIAAALTLDYDNGRFADRKLALAAATPKPIQTKAALHANPLAA